VLFYQREGAPIVSATVPRVVSDDSRRRESDSGDSSSSENDDDKKKKRKEKVKVYDPKEPVEGAPFSYIYS
jgi:hypothetical protein